ncbi:MAG: glycosyltransferase [Owenweeksia sp.]
MTNIFLFPGSLNAGGIEKHNYHLLLHLDRSRFKVFLGLFSNSSNNFGELPGDIEVLTLPMDYSEASRLIVPFFKEKRIQIAYSCAFETSMPLLLAKLKGARFRLVLGRRGFMAYSGKRQLFDKLFQLYAQKVLCNSHRVKKSLSFIGKRKAVVVYNTLDESFVSDKTRQDLRSELGLMPEDYVIGTVGRLCEDKGQRYLIEAFKDLHREHPDIKLLLIGDGELHEELSAVVKDSNLTDKVIFAGNRVNGGDYIKAMDLFVLPSLTESMPNALLEAMFLEKPSVSTKVGGVPEIMEHGKNGFLIERTGDADSIKQVIDKIISGKSNTAQIAEQGRKTVLQKFSLPVNIKKLEDQFANVQ